MLLMIGDKLKNARERKQMSQNEVAEKLLVSRQTISKWENNVCLPDLDNFKKICDLYDIEANTILNSENKIEQFGEERKMKCDEIEVARYCWIPFYFLVVILKKTYNCNWEKADIILLIINIIISLLVVLMIYMEIPKNTTSGLSYITLNVKR